jgi:hypothetical protein
MRDAISQAGLKYFYGKKLKNEIDAMDSVSISLMVLLVIVTPSEKVGPKIISKMIHKPPGCNQLLHSVKYASNICH